MKLMKLVLSISALALTAAGCGSGGGRGGGSTTVLVPYDSLEVYAGACAAVEGPYALPDGASTDFTVTDIDNTDYMDVGVIDDAYGCNFSYAYGAVHNTNSVRSGDDGLPYGYYDFVVRCNNSYYPCEFSLHWTATY